MKFHLKMKKKINNEEILEKNPNEKLELKKEEEICDWSQLQTLLKQEKLLYLRGTPYFVSS